MGRLGWLVAVVIVVLAVSGCGRRDKQASGRKATGASASVPLPEWAPANPSPEFMRAARVLKPMPMEFAEERTQGDLARKALAARYHSTLPAAWEFFGTLSDQEIERLRASKELRIPFRSLSDRQRTALLRYFDVWRQTFKGLPPTEAEYGEDYLVELYKFGAEEDLSNVEITFLLRASGIVAMILRVRRADGSLSPRLPAGLGQMSPR